MLIFQTNINYFTHITDNSTRTQIYIDGKTETGVVRLIVTDFFPYFYIGIRTSKHDILAFLDSKNIEIVTYKVSKKRNIYGYEPDEREFLKVFFGSLAAEASARRMCEQVYEVYDSNIAFNLQFMVDLDIVGMSYIEVEKCESDRMKVEYVSGSMAIFSGYQSTGNNETKIDKTKEMGIVNSDNKEDNKKRIKTVHNSKYLAPVGMVYYVSHKHIKPVPRDDIPPFKTLSFDIEVNNRPDKFPDAAHDEIIQIGNTVRESGYRQVIFCQKETAKIASATVYSYETEKEVIEEWIKFVFVEDPDILLGYNICGFDLDYIMKRAAMLGIVFCLCRLFVERNKCISLEQKAGGDDEMMYEHIKDIMNECKNCKISTKKDSKKDWDRKEQINEFGGRIVIDMLNVIKKEHRLRSYTLNNVSVHFLGAQKENLPYYLVRDLFNANDKTRQRIALYCLKDTMLPLQIYEKLLIFITGVEMVRVLGVPIHWHFNRGIAVKIFGLILREARRNGFVIPSVTVKDDGYIGAFVIEPERGYYDEPIAVLDFASLYPSIIIAHNLCYSTMLNLKACKDNLPVDVSPCGTAFVKREVRVGLLPIILEKMLQKRKEVRAKMRTEKDPFMKALMNARQMAFKISANSVYGFTGSAIGRLPCINISQSVTGYGREMIVKTKEIVETEFCRKKGYDFDSHVIYGDTDSVMVQIRKDNLDADFVFDIARKMAEKVSEYFVKPIRLEFEKVYFPYLLMNKKRYAGVIETREEIKVVNENKGAEKDDGNKKYKINRRIDTKGIETVRRDNCKLVKSLIEESLNLLLMKRDPIAAKKFVKKVVEDLYMDRIDLGQLVISKTLSKTTYAAKQAHVELAERLRKRTGMSINIGDRVAYVIVDKGPGVIAYEKSEDPGYVLEHNLPIDVNYYIEQQIMKPVQRIFGPVMDNVNELFVGEHTKIRKKPPSKGPMMQFVKKGVCCLLCKKGGSILCQQCAPDFSSVYVGKINELKEKEEIYSKCWRECQRCIRSVCTEVLCANKDCPIFFMRTKVIREIEDIRCDIDKLDELEW